MYDLASKGVIRLPVLSYVKSVKSACSPALGWHAEHNAFPSNSAKPRCAISVRYGGLRDRRSSDALLGRDLSDRSRGHSPTGPTFESDGRAASRHS